MTHVALLLLNSVKADEMLLILAAAFWYTGTSNNLNAGASY